MPALGLRAWFWFCVVNSSIQAEWLRWAGLQAAPSSFHRRLLSWFSSLDLLGIERGSLAGECRYRPERTQANTEHTEFLQQEPKFIGGHPFYRGFRTPALEHLIGWGLNTTQLTGQLMSAFRIEWDWLGSPAGVQILLITVLPRDLFTSTL